ncbi:MAG: hypothetical protein ACOYLO_17210 [Ferruginibacter sp.]
MLYYFARIDEKTPTGVNTTYFVSDEIIKSGFIISSHKTKISAVRAMVLHASDSDYFQIGNEKFYHRQLVELLEKWESQ